jgi:hypothetical protein
LKRNRFSAASVTVSEPPREFRFGSHRPNALGQIRLDYPPGKFPILNLRVTAPGFFPATGTHDNDEGISPPKPTCNSTLSRVLW